MLLSLAPPSHIKHKQPWYFLRLSENLRNVNIRVQSDIRWLCHKLQMLAQWITRPPLQPDIIRNISSLLHNNLRWPHLQVQLRAQHSDVSCPHASSGQWRCCVTPWLTDQSMKHTNTRTDTLLYTILMGWYLQSSHILMGPPRPVHSLTVLPSLSHSTHRLLPSQQNLGDQNWFRSH